jgi:sulfatase maturation enzyme AslB (radical SAM superfamily)
LNIIAKFFKKPSIDSKYCVNLFTQVATDNLGYYKPCCHFKGKIKDKKGVAAHTHNMTPLEFFNSEFMKDARKNSLKNKPISGCDLCYKMEANGIQSMRQRHNKERKNLIKLIKKKAYHSVIYALDLRLGNLCNLGCVMCHPEASSILSLDWTTHGYEKFSSNKPNLKLVNWHKKADVVEEIKQQTKDLHYLWLIGGEPLINKDNFKILTSLKERKKDLNLEISTNLTFLNQQIIDQLSNFNTHLKCSIDGIDEFANYIRYPSDFEKIKENIQLLIQSDIKFEFVYTVSVLNILHIKDFYFWFKNTYLSASRPFSFSVTNIVDFPSYLSPENLSLEIKHKAIKELLEVIEDIQQTPKLKLSITSFQQLISYLETSQGDTQIIRDGWKYIESYDKIRGNSWQKITPWLNDILN